MSAATRTTSNVSSDFRAPGKATVLNVDLAVVSAATDVVLGLGDPLRAAIDLNFQASRDAELASRLHVYNALLRYRLRVPVHSTVILLRREADDRALTGKLHYHVAPRRGKVRFDFEVVRLWRQPVKRFLTARWERCPWRCSHNCRTGATRNGASPGAA